MGVSPKMAGLVLAGGRSSRVGAEKAVQVLRGRTMLEIALATLGDVAGPLAVSAAAGSEAEGLAISLGNPVVTDDPVHPRGPLAGIAAGLAWARGAGADFMITLPCDTPLVDAAVLRALGTAGLAETADGPQSLIAVWPVGSLETLTGWLGAGQHPAVHVALESCGVRPVRFEDRAVFANVNTPEDLAKLSG